MSESEPMRCPNRRPDNERQHPTRCCLRLGHIGPCKYIVDELIHAQKLSTETVELIGLTQLRTYVSSLLSKLEAGAVDDVIDLLRAQRDALEILEEHMSDE